jgi:anti-sigma factor RsiW
MINHETELKLQAYLDEELAAGELGAIGGLLARDAGAQSLFEALKATRTLLADNEPELKLPESREFYWSKIQRWIEREEKTPAVERSEPAASSWWIRFLAPAGVLAGVAVFVVVALRNSEPSTPALALSVSHEIETPLEETSSFSFRSESAAMTVVWVDSHRFE